MFVISKNARGATSLPDMSLAKSSEEIVTIKQLDTLFDTMKNPAFEAFRELTRNIDRYNLESGFRVHTGTHPNTKMQTTSTSNKQP